MIFVLLISIVVLAVIIFLITFISQIIRNRYEATYGSPSNVKIPPSVLKTDNKFKEKDD